MNTSLYIAKRYLFSKKSINAIHVISGISMLGITVGSAALIIILSVFNGFEDLILSMYNQLNPEIKITAAEGKFFDARSPTFRQIQNDPRVLNYSEVLEEKALVRYNSRQFIGRIKGVDAQFGKGKSLDSTLREGDFYLGEDLLPSAVIGSAVQAYLSVNLEDQEESLAIYSPRKEVNNSLNPADEFVMQYSFPSGVFKTQQEFDDLVVVPISFTRSLLGEENGVSDLEIELKPGTNLPSFQEELEAILGNGFNVKNRIQQNQLLYKVLNSEKWAIFIILTFVLIVAIFNIIGSLTMLVIDKKKDIAILSSMGAAKSLIRNIFLIEGMMISLTGCLLGMLIGLAFCILQQKYRFIKMQMSDNSLLDAYPVSLKIDDFLLVFATVFAVSLIASAISSRISVRSLETLKENL